MKIELCKSERSIAGNHRSHRLLMRKGGRRSDPMKIRQVSTKAGRAQCPCRERIVLQRGAASPASAALLSCSGQRS